MSKFMVRVGDLRIGARLGAVFALCGLVWLGAFGLDLKTQHDAAAVEDQVTAAEEGLQISDELLIAINEISGWQALYIDDAAAFGTEKGLADDAYNVQGFTESKQGIENLFATMDTSMLTPEESAIITEAKANFDQFFAEDVKLRAQLKSQGLDALPAVMNSINGGPAGESWSATYDAYDRFHKLIDTRVEKLRHQQDADLAAGKRLVLIALGFAVAVAVAMLLLVTRSVVRPMRHLVDQLRRVADGHLDVRSGLRRGDEVGQMSTALDEALESISGSLRHMSTNADDLTAASERLSAVSTQMSGTAADAASQTDLVAAAADQVSHNVQTVAAGTEQMSASIREIAHSATDAAAVAGRAVEAAEATTATVAKLGESSSEVGNVIKVI
ncbi:methyl-accepting chemotaxis protein, partial [Nocardioides sp.]|uniref:methyl-accepting chemotaxis protein n=1 Tax=Nocardioides sp. TaxID=35761 RepID=UPI00261A4D9C